MGKLVNFSPTLSPIICMSSNWLSLNRLFLKIKKVSKEEDSKKEIALGENSNFILGIKIRIWIVGKRTCEKPTFTFDFPKKSLFWK